MRNLTIRASLLAAIVVVALMLPVVAAAQSVSLVPNVTDLVEMKRMYATALDTFWFSPTVPTGPGATVQGTSYCGPTRVFIPKPGGTLKESRLLSSHYLLYATKPFRYRAWYGDARNTGTVHVPVDSTVQRGIIGSFSYKYPCWTWIIGHMDSLRVTPGGSDTLRINIYAKP